MFLLVSNFKMIGMLLNVVHGQVQKKLTKTYNKGFPNHCTLINYYRIHATMNQFFHCMECFAAKCMLELNKTYSRQWLC